MNEIFKNKQDGQIDQYNNPKITRIIKSVNTFILNPANPKADLIQLTT